MTHAIEAHGLSKSFRLRTQRRTSMKERVVRGRAPEPEVFWALRDATFSVPRGASVGLIGQNGSGKSTALKVLTGIYRPTSGEVSVNGRVSALLEVGAGFHPELTGRENIRLNATILGFTGREIDRMMDQIIEFADIGDHIDSPIKHYSSGMYVRLGFAVAVMVRPEILLVDEVIAVGDEEFQRKCFEYLYDLRRSGTSMVIVSHGLGQISDLCDEAVLLDHGRVAELGPADRVVRTYLDGINRREIERQQEVVGVPAEPVGVQPVAEGALPDDDALPGDGVPVRRGSGEIRIHEVEFVDEAGSVRSVLIAGQPATVRLHYRALERMEPVVLGLGVDDHGMRTVWGVNTRHLHGWSVPKGEGRWEFACAPLLLASGSYSLRVQVLSGSHLIDAIDGGVTFTVRPADVEMAGTYLQPGTWSMVAGTASGVAGHHIDAEEEGM